MKPPLVCPTCEVQLPIIRQRFVFEDCHALALFAYQEPLISFIYQYKALGDQRLAEAFLSLHHYVVKDYVGLRTVVLAPSSLSHVSTLGFHPLEELVKPLHRPMARVFRKKDDWKQSDHTAIERLQVGRHIEWVPIAHLPRDVVLFDDILTTGSTLRVCIKLLRKHYPGIRIKVLVLARVLPR